jgi:hypothetical protein
VWAPGLQLAVMHLEAKDLRGLAFIFPPQCDVTEVRFGGQVKYFWKQMTIDLRVRECKEHPNTTSKVNRYRNRINNLKKIEDDKLFSEYRRRCSVIRPSSDRKNAYSIFHEPVIC